MSREQIAQELAKHVTGPARGTVILQVVLIAALIIATIFVIYHFAKACNSASDVAVKLISKAMKKLEEDERRGEKK